MHPPPSCLGAYSNTTKAPAYHDVNISVATLRTTERMHTQARPQKKKKRFHRAPTTPTPSPLSLPLSLSIAAPACYCAARSAPTPRPKSRNGSRRGRGFHPHPCRRIAKWAMTKRPNARHRREIRGRLAARVAPARPAREPHGHRAATLCMPAGTERCNMRRERRAQGLPSTRDLSAAISLARSVAERRRAPTRTGRAGDGAWAARKQGTKENSSGNTAQGRICRRALQPPTT